MKAILYLAGASLLGVAPGTTWAKSDRDLGMQAVFNAPSVPGWV